MALQNGPAIRAIRLSAGRTQEDIAEAAGIDQSYLSLLESENRAASADVIKAIADALKVPAESLTRCPTHEQQVA
jgi:transcriptional regulator with XRE-family HTH domain